MTTWMLVLQKRYNATWLQDYMQAVPPMIYKRGGKYLAVARDVINVENHLMKDGVAEVSIAAIFEFPSRASIEAFLGSEEYQPYAEARKKGSDSDIYILDRVQTDFTMIAALAGRV